jgi:hypothetical protein
MGSKLTLAERDDHIRDLMNMVYDPKARTALGLQINMAQATLDDIPASTLERSWQSQEMLSALRIWALADGVDLYFDWYKMAQTCSGIWAKILPVLEGDTNYEIQRSNGPLHATDNILDRLSQIGEDAPKKKALRDKSLKDIVMELAPEFHTIHTLMQDTIRIPTSPPHLRGVKTWVGDTCIQRLLDRNPHSTRLFINKGVGNAYFIYRNWDHADRKGSAMGKWLNVLTDYIHRQLKFQKGEVECGVCGEGVYHGKERPWTWEDHPWNMPKSIVEETGVKAEEDASD